MILIIGSCKENINHISRDYFIENNVKFNVESWDKFYVCVRSEGFLFSYDVEPYVFYDMIGHCKTFMVIPNKGSWYIRGRNNLLENIDSLHLSEKWEEEYPELEASEIQTKFSWIINNEILRLHCYDDVCYVKSYNYNLMKKKDSLSVPIHYTLWEDWPQGCYFEPHTKYDDEYLGAYSHTQ